nr:geranylgeranylglyceryl/heptaprenylglyceryl phosphate synthase [Brenneria tiliae]
MCSCKKSIIPVIDPFKFNDELNISRLIAFQERAPFCIVASTDCEQFDRKVTPFLSAISKVKRIPIITHFPPSKPNGFPSSPYADAFLATAVINSEKEYYSSLSLDRESVKESINKYGDNNLISSAALVLGYDEKSREFVHSKHIGYSMENIYKELEEVNLDSLQVFYLYSRNHILSKEVCRFVRSLINPGTLLFASGCISNKSQANELFDSGADFISVGTAFESSNWNEKIIEILSGDYLEKEC